MENLRVYLCFQDQSLVDNAISIKAKNAEILWVYIDVEPVPFNRGFYTVDVRYFFKVCCEIYLGVGRPQEIKGLATCDKKVILFGSEGNTCVFTSQFQPDGSCPQNIMTTNMPRASVEMVEPIVLAAKIEENRCCCGETDITALPQFISKCFDGELSDCPNNKKLLVSLGIFSIIRIERNVQLLLPCYDFCVPDKEAVGSCDEKPCDLFRTIKFPMEEFFPPQIRDFPGACCR